jgi:hypothetical protein
MNDEYVYVCFVELQAFDWTVTSDVKFIYLFIYTFFV